MENIVEQLQNKLIRCLKQNGIKDKAILDAFATIKRYDFVKDYVTNLNELYSAYMDAFPIGYGQTISQPLMCATMIEALEIDTNKTVLEVGTGSGYLTALLAKLSKYVHSIDVHENFCQSTKKKLQLYNITNVTCEVANVFTLHDLKFDRIIISAALNEFPQTLLGLLNNSGILVAPVNIQPNSYKEQNLLKIKKNNDSYDQTIVCKCRFVPIIKE